MIRCGCNPVQEPYEFPIENVSTIYNTALDINCGNNCKNRKQDLYKLKQKIIQDFLDIINKLECGIQPDLEDLKEGLTIVYIKENEVDIPTKKHRTKSLDIEETTKKRKKKCIKPLNNKEIDKIIQKVYGM